MQKRLFVGIKLPEDIKKRLFRLIEKDYAGLPVKWGRPENLHLTLLFLGFVQEEKIPQICEDIRDAAEMTHEFDLDFKKIELGPKAEAPKMVWVTGEKNETLEELKYNLDKEMGVLAANTMKFTPHVTLGRIEKRGWNSLKEKPNIEKDFKFSFGVSSVELMESKYEKGKRVYYTMESFALK